MTDDCSLSSCSDLTSNNNQEKKPKRRNKLFDGVVRDLPNDASDEQKLQILSERIHEAILTEKNSQTKIKQQGQLLLSLQHERDQLQAERNRLILQKDKLETLCRELQKQAKIVQEESLARTRAEEEKRRQVADHFHSSIVAIQTQLNEYQSRNTELRQENQDLATKLEEFIKQHGKREEHVDKVLHTRDLEVKLAEAKCNKVQCQLDQEQLKSQQKCARMEEEAKLMQNRLDTHLALEEKLKEQIEFYKSKYQNFNKTLARSNKLFDSAKEDMDKFAKRMKQSEHDAVEWRGKWELSQRSLLEVLAEHKKQVEATAVATKRADCLGGLCRALQAQLNERRGIDAAAAAAAAGGDVDGGGGLCTNPLPNTTNSDCPTERGDDVLNVVENFEKQINIASEFDVKVTEPIDEVCGEAKVCDEPDNTCSGDKSYADSQQEMEK